VVTARPEQLVARRDFDEDRNVAAGRHRHADQRHAQPEDLVEHIVQPKPLVLARRIPSFELHDQLDPLRRSRRRDAEQFFDVDDAESAQLHVMAGQLRTGADQDRLLPAAHFDRVVGHQSMAADNEIQRAFALADAALARNQHAQPEDVHQHGVQNGSLGERILENRAQLRDRGRRRRGGFQQRHARPLRLDHELHRRCKSARYQDARKVEREGEPERGHPRGDVEALQVPDFALAEDQDPSALQVLVETGQREACFLDVRAGDDSIEAVGAREQVEREAKGVRPAGEQRCDSDTGFMVAGHWSLVVGHWSLVVGDDQRLMAKD
jgi:hypothetical protein